MRSDVSVDSIIGTLELPEARIDSVKTIVLRLEVWAADKIFDPAAPNPWSPDSIRVRFRDSFDGDLVSLRSDGVFETDTPDPDPFLQRNTGSGSLPCAVNHASSVAGLLAW